MTRDEQPGRVVITWLAATDLDNSRLIGLVADFAGMPSSDIRIVRACRSCGSDRHGKPQIVAPAALHASLSRAGERAVVAVTDAGPIGIDVERVRPDEDLTSWVRKESVVKATGHGLRIDPDRIDVGPADSPPQLRDWPVEEPIGASAWIVDLPSPDGHVAAATILSTVRPIVTTQAAPEA